jgi:1-acyl-sn-glycerol-3-phosphate acyltransferase
MRRVDHSPTERQPGPERNMWLELATWLGQARRRIPRADRRVLLSPPRLVARFARYALARQLGQERAVAADDAGARDPELVSFMLDFVRLMARAYFRLRVEGVEHVPASGPALLVGNHNGGLVPMDGLFTSLAVHDHLGASRAVYALVHDFLLADPLLRRYAGALGMLRADEASARHAFAHGDCVLVYPGSDRETFRTFRERGKVVLAGRKGFIRLALREGVPIVPVVSAGTHEQFVVLTRGDRLARLLGMHRWARTDVFPLVLAVPWGLTSGFVPYLPLPAQTTLAFAPALHWPELVGRQDDPEIVDRCYHEVERRMQETLDRLQAGRRVLLGQPAVSAPR